MRRALIASVAGAAVLAVTLAALITRRARTVQSSALSASPRPSASAARRAPGSANHALALSWGSFALTDVDAAPLNRDHGLTLWFMAAYEAAFRGVLVADESGSYHLGLAPYASLGAVALEVSVGGATLSIPITDPVLTNNDIRDGVPRQLDRKWRHLAVSRRAERVAIYLDGAPVGELTAGGVNARGPLRFGRLARADGAQDQFYGFIDDIELHARALDAATLAKLRSGSPPARPRSAAPATFTFEPSPSGVASSLRLEGTARLAEVSANRAAALDSARLPKPAHATRFRLPFADEQVWMVIQGINSGLSHNDIAAFALDFIRVDPRFVRDNAERLPGGSHRASDGAALLAAAPGRVASLVDCFADDNSGRCAGSGQGHDAAAPQPSSRNRNLLCVEHAKTEFSCLLHLQQRSSPRSRGDAVTAGTPLARAGKTGVLAPHLHFAVSDRAEPNEPGAFADLVTLPFVFYDYFSSSDFGASWRHVSAGSPAPGEWVRTAPPADLRRSPVPGSPAPSAAD